MNAATLWLLVGVLLPFGAWPLAALAADAAPQRLRLIIETDAGGDSDDEQSLVRFLLYANEWDIEGIIHIICEVTDDGSPELTRYQRVIVEFTNR